MLLAELTFTQEIAKAAIGSVLTGLFVTVGGGIAVSRVTKGREERRQRFDLRTTMFITRQHVARVLGRRPSERFRCVHDFRFPPLTRCAG